MAMLALKNLAGAAGGTGASDAPQMLVDTATAVTSVMGIFREEARKISEQNRQDDNDFNIRKNFLENAVAAINDLLQGQYNIMILTDQEHDVEWGGPLKGRLLPMDLVEVEISGGRKVNFQVMVFDSGKYLRKGKWEEDSISWYPESAKMWKDVNMHIEFNDQPKKPTDGIPAKDELHKKEEGQKATDDAAAQEKAEADKRAADDTAAAQNAEKENEPDEEKEGEENEDDSGYGSSQKSKKGTITNPASHVGANGALNEDNETAIKERGKPDVKGKKTATDKKKSEDNEYGEDGEDEDGAYGEDAEEGEEDEEEDGEEEDGEDEDGEEDGEDEDGEDEDGEDGEDEDAEAEDPEAGVEDDEEENNDAEAEEPEEDADEANENGEDEEDPEEEGKDEEPEEEEDEDEDEGKEKKPVRKSVKTAKR